ncbi:MAG: P1 family peptidase [Vicinamibacteria bacterium]
MRSARFRSVASVLVLLLAGAVTGSSAPPADRPRARDLGIAPGVLQPGPLNAITDVAGVRVGQITIIEGANVRTGVTAILPHPGNLFQDKVPGAVFVGNAFGKLAGSTQVQELGTIETPIILSNTLAVGTAVDAVVGWTLAQPGNGDVRSVNALVGETNDGGLSDIRAQPVRKEQVLAAIRDAREGAVAEGAVGAGTGTVAFGWKGGIGTSSRVTSINGVSYTVGVLVQTNFGGILMMDGVPVGKELMPRKLASAGPALPTDLGDGSCMIVVATDAPLSPKDLNRLAARGVFALARTGSSYSNGSGDFAIAFSTDKSLRVAYDSTAIAPRATLPTDAVSPLFEAVLEGTEEAVLNSMLKAETMTGNGHAIKALDIDVIRELLKKYGRTPEPR